MTTINNDRSPERLAEISAENNRYVDELQEQQRQQVAQRAPRVSGGTNPVARIGEFVRLMRLQEERRLADTNGPIRFYFRERFKEA